MKIVAVIFVLAALIFPTNSWSQTKFYKIPTQEKKPAKKQKAKPAKRQQKGNIHSTIQVGSFKTLKEAQHEVARLKSFAVPGFIGKVKIGNKGTWYRVYIGKFRSNQEATSYAKQLKKKKIIGASLIKRIRLAPKKTTAKKTKKHKIPTAKRKPGPTYKGSPPRAKTAEQTTPPKQKSAPKPEPQKSSLNRKSPSVGTKYRQQPPKKPTTLTTYQHKSMHPGRFSIGLRGAALIASKASDFEIRRDGTSPKSWEFENYKPLLSIVPNLRISDRWSIEAALEQSVFTNVKMQFLTMGPKFHFFKDGKKRPYLRAAIAYGTLEWDDAPGDFDDSLGAEIGAGVDFIGSHFSYGIDAAYRNASFDYNAPSDPNVSSAASEIDYSGFTLSGILRYHF